MQATCAIDSSGQVIQMLPFTMPTWCRIVPHHEVPYAEVSLIHEQLRCTIAIYEEELTDQPEFLQVAHSKIMDKVPSFHHYKRARIGTVSSSVRVIRLNAFDDRYVEFVQAVANQISIGIENQILFNVAQSERERLQTILSTLPTGVVIVLDPEILYSQFW